MKRQWRFPPSVSQMSKRKRQPPKSSEKKPAVQQASISSSTTSVAVSWQGPIPPPRELREYDLIVPGAASRILGMAEQQSTHRMALEKHVVTGDSRRSYLGLILGFIIALTFLGGGIFLIYSGHTFSGLLLGGLDLVSLVSVFVIGTNSRKAERERKAATMPRPRR